MVVAQLIRAFGVDLETYIPDQEFVARAILRSVVGFGGALENGDLFATILFSLIAITERAADRFRTLALDLKRRFLLYSPEQVFEPETAEYLKQRARSFRFPALSGSASF